MRIDTLALDNITCFEQATFHYPKKITVMVSGNASGKTTQVDAITYLLTKTCARTDKGGRGAERMVRTGSKQGSITGKVSANGTDPLVLDRSIPGDLKIEGQHGNTTQLQANLEDNLGARASVIAAALSSSRLLEMKPAEQKGLLFGLMNLRFERDDILGQIALALPPTFQEQRSKAVGRVLGKAPDDCWTGDASTFPKLYDYVYTLRRDVNRDIKNLGEPQKIIDDDVPDKGEIVDLLESLRVEKQELQKQLIERTSSARERGRLTEHVEMLTGKLEDAGDPEAAQTEHKTVQEKIASLVAAQHVALARAESHQEAADKLAGASKSCPLAPNLVDCSMTKPKREKMVSEMTTIAEAALVEAGKTGTKIVPLKKREAELAAEAKKPSKEGLESQIMAAEKELEKLPKPSGSMDEANLGILTERIKAGEELLARANHIEGIQEAHEQQVSKRAVLEQEAEVLDALVKVLSPKGLPGQILSQTIGPIETRANERLQELTGGRYQLSIQTDPDFAILVDHDGIQSDLDGLSASEKWRVGLVLQDAIAQLSGLRFLLIDGTDILDPENRALFMDALLQMAEDYDQIIAFSTLGPAGVHAPEVPIPDLGLYLLKDGKVEEVV